MKALFTAVSEDLMEYCLCINLIHLWSISLYPSLIAEYTLFTASAGLIINVPIPSTGALTPFESVMYSTLFPPFFMLLAIVSFYFFLFSDDYTLQNKGINVQCQYRNLL